jgi:hypothetical protein
MRRPLVVAFVVLLAGGLTANVALAKRAPTSAERPAILATIDAFIQKPGSPAASDNRVVSIRLNTPGAHYARVNLNSASAGPAIALVRLRYGAWRVIAFGSADFRCKLAPAAIWRDLFPRGFCRPAA